MALLTHISTQARVRASGDLSFAGDVTPQEAWDMLSAHPESRLIDVRTDMEWKSVGVPDLSPLSKEAYLLSLLMYPGMSENPLFLTSISDNIPDKKTPLIFLCKTGGRSTTAAKYSAAQGYSTAFNVLNGYEGVADEAGLRNTINGWRAEGLPWRNI